MGILCKYNECQEGSGKTTCSYLSGFLKHFFFKIKAVQNAKTRDGSMRLPVSPICMCECVCACANVCVCACVLAHAYMLSCSIMSDSATPWTVACQAPLSMGFPQQEYWRVLPFPPQRALSNEELSLPLLYGSRFFTIFVVVVVSKTCPILCNPMYYSPPPQAPLSMGFPRQEY